MTKLQSLQSIVELNEFLKFIESNQYYTFDLNKKVENLLNLWSHSMPNIYTDPPSTWDDVITNRTIYLEFIEDKYYKENNKQFESTLNFSILMQKNNDEDTTSDKMKTLKKIEKIKLNMQINFAQAAMFQGNYTLALRKLKQTGYLNKNQSNNYGDLKITWLHCYLNTHLSRAKLANNCEKKLNIFLGALCLKEIVKYDNNEEFIIRNDLKRDQQILHGKFCKFLIESFISDESYEKNDYFDNLKNDDKKSKQLFDYIKISPTSDLNQVK
jgi:hypothetical protein